MKNLLKQKCRIFHIGSTAVPGVNGKQIIDILISVKKTKIKKILKKLMKKYIYTGSGGSKQRWFMFRDIKYNNLIRRVHIHLTWFNSGEEKNSLKFITKLKENKNLILEYNKIKKNAIKIAKGEGSKYRALKDEFIKRVLD